MAARTVNGLPPALDESCKSLYVGNLDPRVTDMMLGDIFRTMGEVTHVKIIPDKNYQHGGLNYGFVDFLDHKTALSALETLNGRKVMGHEIKVNWAYQGNNATREDTSVDHHHVFVGDLSADVTDQVLMKAFSAFGSLTDARVMWDMNTGKSRGYGFLAFREKEDAERAIASMNGEWLGSRSIRVNWANQKNQNQPPNTEQRPQRESMGSSHYNRDSSAMSQQPLNYEVIVNQTSYTNVTVYVGNLAPSVREADIYPYFQPYGYVQEIRMQHDRGFAFVRMDSHEHAAMAICYLNGTQIHGRPLKVSWGKDKFAEQRDGIPHQMMQGMSGSMMPGQGMGAMVPAADPSAALYQQYAQYYGNQYNFSAPNPAAAPSTIPIPPPDSSSLPPLSDPIAAAAAAAAQAAVQHQIQQQQQQQTTTDGTQVATGVPDPSSNTYDYYQYYYQYYYGQQHANPQGVMPPAHPAEAG